MLKNTNYLLKLILYLIDEEYRGVHPNIFQKMPIEKIDMDVALKMAVQNKVSGLFCKNVINQWPELFNENIKNRVEQEEKSLIKLRRTIELVTSAFGNNDIDFLVIKTFKGIPFATNDLDIYVRKRDYQQATNVLENVGIRRREGNLFLRTIIKLRLGTPDFVAQEILDIDVYPAIPWIELPTADEEFLWDRPRVAGIAGVDCPIPNCEADLLILIATTLFTDGKITLLDFLYLNSLLKMDLNIDELRQQTMTYGWNAPFFDILSSIKNMKHALYTSESDPSEIDFPYLIPMPIVFRSLPGPFKYQITRAPNSIFIAFGNIGVRTLLGRVYGNVWWKKQKFLQLLRG